LEALIRDIVVNILIQDVVIIIYVLFVVLLYIRVFLIIIQSLFFYFLPELSKVIFNAESIRDSEAIAVACRLLDPFIDLFLGTCKLVEAEGFATC